MPAPDLLVIAGLGLCSALLLFAAQRRYQTDNDSVVSSINRLLPQTQCAQCGYPGCRPYAEAIAGGAPINRCPPGGGETIAALAELLGREPMTLDPDYGEIPEAKKLAVINEAECIGCTLCMPVCPVDAIVGAPQQMHTVLSSLCTGCDLCREPCPVDCIELVSVAEATLPPMPPIHTACINCGDCEPACPKGLQPQMLFWYRQDIDRTVQHRLEDCILCGRCDRACPSELPLTESFGISKRRLVRRTQQAQAAAAAELRYQQHRSRLEQTGERVAERPSDADRSALLAQLRGDP